MLTTKQLAARLGISPRTAERWRREGYGPPACKLSRKVVRYDESDLERWQASLKRFQYSGSATGSAVRGH